MKLSKKTLIILGTALVVVLLAAGTAWAYGGGAGTGSTATGNPGYCRAGTSANGAASVTPGRCPGPVRCPAWVGSSSTAAATPAQNNGWCPGVSGGCCGGQSATSSY
jgi:hypothetical protein